jgi:RloB-like protein
VSRRENADEPIGIRGHVSSSYVAVKGRRASTFADSRDSVANRAVDVTFLNKAKDPLSLVSYATIQRSIASKDFDMVWCVFDVDEFSIERACELATQEALHLAISNPCFELWLLLHFEHRTSYLNACGPAVTRLRKRLQNYDKARISFADFSDGLDDAIARAKHLEPTGRNHVVNPSTSVWRLVETIIGSTNADNEK